VVRQESNETGAIFFYLTFTYKSTLSPSKSDTKFDRATLLEISFLHFRNAFLLHTHTTRCQIRHIKAIKLKLALIIK